MEMGQCDCILLKKVVQGVLSLVAGAGSKYHDDFSWKSTFADSRGVIMSKCSEDISKSPLNHISRENKDIGPLPLSTPNTICKSVWRRYDLPCSEQDTDFHENRYDFRNTPQKKSYNAVHHFLKGNTSTLTPYHYFGQNMGIVTSWYPLKQPRYWFSEKNINILRNQCQKMS